MHIERHHKIEKAEAIRKVDGLMDDLMRRGLPQGVTIKEVSKTWSENTLRFSFKAQKSFFGATISGVIRVEDECVIFDAALPGLITTFVPEDKIEDALNKEFDSLFPA
jgi:hypothetical protein